MLCSRHKQAFKVGCGSVSSLVNEEIIWVCDTSHICTCNSISHTLIGQIKSHVQIILGRVCGGGGRARAIARVRMTRLVGQTMDFLLGFPKLWVDNS